MRLFGFQLGRSPAPVALGPPRLPPKGIPSPDVAALRAREEGMPVGPGRFGENALRPDGLPPLVPDAEDGLEAVQVLQATPELEQFYRFSYSGRVHTAPGGPARVADATCDVIALMDARVLLVAATARFDPVVISLHERLRRLRVAPTVHLLVDPEVVLAVYDSDRRRDRVRGGATERTTPAERLFLELVRHCVEKKASDLHVDVEGGACTVRYRVDGRLQSLGQPLKVDAGRGLRRVAYQLCDDSDGPMLRTRSAQRGRISGDKVTLPPGLQSMRLEFNVLARHGEYLVVRFFYSESLHATDESALGYSDAQVVQLRELRLLSAGLNCIAGATGSGKSTTLRVCLQALAYERENSLMIMTVEDPPEVTMSGVRQLAVVAAGDERDAAFNAAILSMLRSDPDVIMIGEIRDAITASLSVRAAETGHQVWTTVHATRAPRVITRLIDEGLPPGRILDPDLLSGIVAQRLVALLCPLCAITWAQARDSLRYPAVFFDQIEAIFGADVGQLEQYARVRRAHGWCATSGCHDGYVGQTVVAEVVRPDVEYMRAYERGLPRDAEEYWVAQCGGVRIAEHGAVKALNSKVDFWDLNTSVVLSDLYRERIPSVLGYAEELRESGSHSVLGLSPDDAHDGPSDEDAAVLAPLFPG